MEHIGKVIRSIRAKKGISGAKLSQSIGKYDNFVSNIENNLIKNLTVADLRSIFKGLDISTRKTNLYLRAYGFIEPPKDKQLVAETLSESTPKLVDSGIFTNDELVEKCRQDAQKYMEKYIMPIKNLPAMTQKFIIELLQPN